MKFDDKYSTARPYIAAFVILRRGDKIAMTLRRNTGWKDDHYGVPAGKIEWDETYLQGAVREAKEEAGVDVEQEDLKMVHVVHRHSLQENGDFMDWVDLYFEATKWEGEPSNVEPEKSERLDWLDINNLPENIVPEQRAALVAVAKGEIYGEFGWPSS